MVGRIILNTAHGEYHIHESAPGGCIDVNNRMNLEENHQTFTEEVLKKTAFVIKSEAVFSYEFEEANSIDAILVPDHSPAQGK